MKATREQRIEQALFRGGSLTLENSKYRNTVRTITDELLLDDLAPSDLTVKALGIKDRHASAAVITRDGGVAAGLEEFAFLLRGQGVNVAFEKKDGDVIQPGETLLRAEGAQSKLL